MQLHAMCIFAIGLFAMFKYITSNKSFINKNNDCVKNLFYEQIYALNLIFFSTQIIIIKTKKKIRIN